MTTKKASKLSPETYKVLGRLTSLGLTEAWQVALLLPTEWRDYRSPTRTVQEMDVSVILEAEMARDAETGFHNGTPRLSGAVLDDSGQELRFYLYGDHRETVKELTFGTTVILRGVPSMFHGRLYLHQAELVPKEWAGKLCPRYPGKVKVIKPDTVRERVLALGNKGGAWRAAVGRIREMLAEHGDPDTALRLVGIGDLAQTIRDAHLPGSLDEGVEAQAAIERLAALLEIAIAQSGLDSAAPRMKLTVDQVKVQARIDALPYPLTDEQQFAIQEILADLQKGKAMRRILSGDVGTGKTFVYAVVAAAIADHGGRVAILAPTLPLANQVAGEVRKPWPDLKVAVVAGDAEQGALDASILVGTTALLHRDIGQIDLAVVDEQQ
jgi:ATP-dependent DNA helicase RecG